MGGEPEAAEQPRKQPVAQIVVAPGALEAGQRQHAEQQHGDVLERQHATTYHSLSVSRSFDNGLMARLGVVNVLDETPPRMTNQGTGNEVDVLGQVAFYSQYDWLGRRYFLNLSVNFD